MITDIFNKLKLFLSSNRICEMTFVNLFIFFPEDSKEIHNRKIAFYTIFLEIKLTLILSVYLVRMIDYAFRI